MTELYRGPCPYCKATIAVDGTPASVAPSEYVHSSYKPETVTDAKVNAITLIAPPAPSPTPTPTPPAPVIVPFPAPALIKRVTGVQRKIDYRPAPLPDGMLLDARGLVMKGQEHYPINWYGNGRGRWIGGHVEGTWDELTTPWTDAYHSFTGMIAGWPYPVVEGFRCHNYGDPVRFNQPEVVYFEQRWGWYTNMHDDGFGENDRQKNGLIEDCLVDGCHVGYSQRRDKTWTSTGNANSVTIRRSLIRLAPFALTSEPTKPNTHGGFFKVDTRDPTSNPWLHFEDLVVCARMNAATGDLDLNPSKRTTAKNCVVVWLGAGEYPVRPLPVGWTLTRDASVWEKAKADHLAKRAAWVAALPAAA